MSRRDPVCLAAVMGIGWALGALALPGPAAETDPGWRAGGRASAGCLDPEHAFASDWRTVPGVSRRIATELEAACHATGACSRAAGWPAIRGIGPALSQRLSAARCRDTAAAAQEPATPRSGAHACGSGGASWPTAAAW